MSKTRGFLLAVAFATMAFSLSCSSDGDPPNYGGSKGNDIENYKTKKIGNQTWIAENLDYYVEGSKCYNDDPANCAKYGRLYNWSTAMALDPNCDFTSCSGEIQQPHRGICPEGWHIPSYDDWDVLFHYVENDKGLSGSPPGGSYTAGGYLKATSGWNYYEGQSGNGTDDYGFSALPGGAGRSDNGSFSSVGLAGCWWSSTETDGSSNEYAYLSSMKYDDAVAFLHYGGNKDHRLYSVRCLKN